MEKKEKENQNFSLTVWKKMLPFFRPYYRYFVTTVSLNVLLVLMDVGIPLFQSYAIDQFIVPNTLEGIGVFAVIYGLAILMQTVSLFFLVGTLLVALSGVTVLEGLSLGRT